MQNILIMPGQTFTVSFHTYDPAASPPAPRAIDSDYNGGMPYISVLQNGSPVDSTVFGLYVENPGCWRIVANPDSSDPAQDLVATGLPNRYDVQFTPNSSQSGLYQVVAIAQVNGYEGCAVMATVQVGPVAANAGNLPSDYLSSEEQLQLATLTSETIGSAALKAELDTIQAKTDTLPAFPANFASLVVDSNGHVTVGNPAASVSITTENTVINSN